MERKKDGTHCFLQEMDWKRRRLIYHSDYEGVKKALSEIHRVLKPGGEAYITFNAKDNPKFHVEFTTDGYTMIPQDGLEQGIPSFIGGVFF